MDKGGTPSNVATAKGVETLIPSTKPVFKRYWSGDIAKSAFGSDHGVTSGKFWRHPTKEEEKKMRIIKKGSNPELFFKLTNSGRMCKSTFFGKNPWAIKEMGEIIDNNTTTWKPILKETYGIFVHDLFGKQSSTIKKVQ